MVESTVSAIENGNRGTSLGNVRFLARALACEETDLFGVGTQRLAAIRADFLQREADRAREEVQAAS